MPCERCGAVVDPGALVCIYCGAPTLAAAVARQHEVEEAHARAQWAAADEQRRAIAARARVDALATQALTWGVLGAVLCCLPFGAAGLVQGLRARGLAAVAKQAAPVRATIGVALSALSVLSSIGFVIWAIVSAQGEQQRADARIAALTRQIGTQANSATLDRTTACALAEAYALRNGWNGANGYTLHDFECVGKMVPRGDRTELDDFRFRSGTDSSNDTFVCFKRGAAWLVDELRHDACHGASTEAAPTATVRHYAPGDPLAPSATVTPRGSSPAPSGSTSRARGAR